MLSPKLIHNASTALAVSFGLMAIFAIVWVLFMS